jgi:hypothetical protein
VAPFVATEAQPHRPLQGWRYLPATEAPADRLEGIAEEDALPAAMAAELRELGLI